MNKTILIKIRKDNSRNMIIQSRDGALDLFRGIAAVNIVWLHTVAIYGSGLGLFIAMMFDAPLFFFLSGWSATYSCKFPRILSRCIRMWLLWGIFIFLLNVISGIVFSVHSTPGQMLRDTMFMGWSLSTFNRVGDTGWFLRVFLAVIPVTTLVIDYSVSRKWNFKEFITFVFVLILGVAYLSYNPEGYFYYIPRRVMFYGIFYFMGYVTNKYDVRITGRRAIVLIIISGIMWYICGESLSVNLLNVQEYKFVIPNIVYLFYSLISVIIVLFLRGILCRSVGGYFTKCVRWIGRNAISFYMAQAVGDQVIGYIFGKSSRPIFFKLFVAFVVSLTVTFLVTFILMIINKVLNKACDKLLDVLYRILGACV